MKCRGSLRRLVADRFGLHVAGLVPRLSDYLTTLVVIVTSAGEVRRTLSSFAVTNSIAPQWVHIGGSVPLFALSNGKRGT